MRGALLTWPVRTIWRVLVLGWANRDLHRRWRQPGCGGHWADHCPGSRSRRCADRVYESAPWYGYGLPTFVSPDQGLAEQMMWGALNLISLLLDLASAVFVRGALAAMQWMLDLTLYRDNAADIDTATQRCRLRCVLAADRLHPGGRGFHDVREGPHRRPRLHPRRGLKVGILGVLAIAFVMAPSKIVGPLDDARTAASDAIMTGLRRVITVGGDIPAGFPPVTIPPGPGAASRTLADAMWSTFIVTPWCYTAFGGEDLRANSGDRTSSPERPSGPTVRSAASSGNDALNQIEPGSKPDTCVADLRGRL